MKLIVRDDSIKELLAETPFEVVRAIDGQVVRHKEGRKTQRFEVNGEGFYVKHHSGVGWGEIIKNLVQLRLPILGAKNEWQAIELLNELKLSTLDAVAFGEQGANPATQESFLITRELTGTRSLAKVAEEWPASPPPVRFKRSIINKVAEISREIHRAGMNHRDLYICHFLMKDCNPEQVLSTDDVTLYLVDLHRAQLRAEVPLRWQVKDVGSLLFSAMDVGLTSRDVYRFLKEYFEMPLRDILNVKADLLDAFEKRAIALYRRDFKREPVLPYSRVQNP